jgi:lysophospholipid acyltransferase (LPLAT)-like uncharacterized protein
MTPRTTGPSLSPKARRVGLVGSLLMRLWCRTLQFRFIDHAHVLRKHNPEKPLLWAFWHNRLFIMGYMFQRFFPGRPGAALASASKDGEIISALLERFGIASVRGSSSKRGAVALVEMKRALQRGSVMAITPDGPRGPKYQVNPGVVKLAQIFDGSILPVHVRFTRYWTLKSWDGFRLPKPFSAVEITFLPLHPVPQTSSDSEFEAERLRFQSLLRGLEDDAPPQPPVQEQAVPC